MNTSPALALSPETPVVSDHIVTVRTGVLHIIQVGYTERDEAATQPRDTSEKQTENTHTESMVSNTGFRPDTMFLDLFNAPKIWNDFPNDVRLVTALHSFRRKLKSYLFTQAYPP